MMCMLHLLWIIPAAGIFGFGVCAVLTVAKHTDNRAESQREERKITDEEGKP